jgi:hypothetical protein
MEKKKLRSIEDLYDKYKKTKGKLKRHLIMGGVKFDIDPRFEIIDLGINAYSLNLIIIQLDKEPMVLL